MKIALEGLKKFPKDIEDDFKDPDDENPPILGLLMLLTLLHERWKKI
jgi:hypothetical protein